MGTLLLVAIIDILMSMKMTTISRLLMVSAFLCIFSLFLYIANVVVYEALAVILHLTETDELFVLGMLLFIFSGSFIASMLLGMRYYNVFTRIYYLGASLWIGLFTYLFFVSVLYGFLLMLHADVANMLGIPLLVMAVVISIYGFINARLIKIVSVTIPLPHLPPSWEGRKAVWISDVHLGQFYGPAYAEMIVEKVNALPHDIIFIGGDLYDGTGASDIEALVAPLGRFRGKLGTYFITGNHEEIGDSSAFVSAVKSACIRPLLDEMIEIDGVQIIGIDYQKGTDKTVFQETLTQMAIQSHMPSLLLKHEPKDIDVARDAGISVQLSGHTHNGQMWPFGYVANLVYKGFGYGLNRLGNTYVYTSSGAGTWGPPLRVGTHCEIVHITFVRAENMP